MLREQVNQGWTNRDIIWPDLTTDTRHRIRNGCRGVGDEFFFGNLIGYQ